MTRAPISLPGRTIIVDYGEVISLAPSAADREVITGLAGVSGDSRPFWRAYFAHRDGLDQGSAGAAAYWHAIARDVGASWDDARVHELCAADFRSLLSINPGTIEVLADLKAGGTRLALLSNAGPAAMADARCRRRIAPVKTPGRYPGHQPRGPALACAVRKTEDCAPGHSDGPRRVRHP